MLCHVQGVYQRTADGYRAFQAEQTEGGNRRKHAGTTAVTILVVDGERALVANAGDSRAIVITSPDAVQGTVMSDSICR